MRRGRAACRGGEPCGRRSPAFAFGSQPKAKVRDDAHASSRGHGDARRGVRLSAARSRAR
jgi:hypothetical protein